MQRMSVKNVLELLCMHGDVTVGCIYSGVMTVGINDSVGCIQWADDSVGCCACMEMTVG